MARRGYVQLLNEFYENEKIKELRQTCPSAVGMFAMILSYCGDKMTDGHIRDRPLKYVLQATDVEIDALCGIGMLEPDGNDGYWVHDYLAHNRSKAQIQHVSAQTKARVQKFRARKTAGVTASHKNGNDVTPDTDTTLRRESNGATSGQTPEHQKDISYEISSPPVGPPREGDAQAALFDAPSEPVKKKRRSKTLLPETWRPGARHERRAREVGADLRIEATKFANWAVANGKTYADWDRAFDNWLLNSRKYDGPSKTDGRSPSRSQMNLAANMAKTWEYMTDEERARFTGGGLHAVQG